MGALTLVIGNKNYSSWSMRAWVLLRHFGIEFDEILVRLQLEDSPARKLAFSPAGRVPVLLDGEFPIWDTLAIVEYVAEQFPEMPIWPVDAEARARARSVSAEMHSSFFALRDQMPMNTRAHRPGAGRGPGVEEDIARVCEIWRECRDRHSGDGDFLFGAFSAADAIFSPVAARFETYGVSLDEIEAEYSRSVLALAAVEEWYAGGRAESWSIPLYEAVSPPAGAAGTV
jgi:glutathione S-transferase